MIHYLLKMMAFMAAFAGMQAAVPVQAAVSMISFQHRVWGNAGQNTYDQTGSSPLSGGRSDNYNYASSSASDWSVNSYRVGNAYDANAFAENTYVFRPHSPEVTILLNGVIGVWWYENKAKMTLTNLSNNSLVSSYYSPSYTGINPFPSDTEGYPFVMRSYPFSWATNVEVNPEHEYELIIYASAHRGEGGDGSASLNLTIVPEPGTMLLAGMAALFMCGCRHRPKAAR